MVLQAILEGLGLGALLVLVCAAAIRKGAVHMVHLYHADVQARCVALGLTTGKRSGKTAFASRPFAFRGIWPMCWFARMP